MLKGWDISNALARVAPDLLKALAIQPDIQPILPEDLQCKKT